MKTNIYQNIVLFTSALLLLLAPLFRAGIPPLPLLILELLGIIILFVFFWDTSQYKKISKMIWGLLIAIALLPLLYLIPLPASIVHTLPGRELYSEVLQWASINSSAKFLNTASLIPEKTLDAYLSLAPVMAIFLAVMSLTINKAKVLCYIFLGIVGVEALIALAQFTSGNNALYFGLPNSHVSQGTYHNRDHFAALMEMGLPITLGLLAISFSQKSSIKNQHLHFLSRLSAHSTLIYASLSLVILLASIFSHSRSGIFLILLGVLISTLSFARHIGGKQSINITATISTFSIAIATSIGIIPVINRLITTNPLEDGRYLIFKHSIEAIQNFFPVGSGPGTFPYVYRAFQPVEQIKFINNAHNDYFELLVEMGVFGMVIVVLFFYLYLSNWKRIKKSFWLPFRYIQMGAGIGMFLVLLHGLTDFNFHIPANMIFFGFLAGLFFHSTEKRPASYHFNKSSKCKIATALPPRKTALKSKSKNPFSK